MEYKEVIVEDLEDHVDFQSNNYISPKFSSGCFCLKDDRCLIYLKDGLFHRDNYPAYIYYGEQTYFSSFNKKGERLFITQFTFYVNGWVHNENGPALIKYYLSDSDNEFIIEKIYYLNSIRYSKEEYEKQIQTKLYW